MDSLKGFRTQIAVYGPLLISWFDDMRELLVQLVAALGATVSEGGAVAALIAITVSLKALFTDTLPKLKGELKR